jgi:transcriptional antiterminator Rof (Rho-off)
VGFSKGDHALLADILRALKQEDVLRLAAVAHEVLSLELSLGEVFNQNARAHLAGKVLDKGHNDGLLVLGAGESTVLQELVEVEADHVGAGAKSVAEGGLARGVGTNNEGNLGKHGFAGGVPDLGDVAASIDFANAAELTVEFDNGLGFF